MYTSLYFWVYPYVLEQCKSQGSLQPVVQYPHTTFDSPET